jgi:ketosteroid isomerase-like protein
MSEPQDNAQLLRAGIEAFNRGDYEDLVALFDPAIECHVASGLGNPGTWHGIDGFLEMTTTWNESFADQRSEVRSVDFPDDEHVIAEIHQTAVGAVSDVPVEMTVVYLLQVRDGRAVRFGIYGDRSAALAASANG